jgi:DNA-binding NarL/FixJ family response regulator
MKQAVNNNNKIIKISIIEDSKIHREWLKTELLESPNIKIVSIDQLGRAGIDSVKQHQPHLVILDFQLEDITGIEASLRIKTYNDNIKIFIITAHMEISIIERLVNDKNIDAIAIKGSHYFENNLLTAVHHIIDGGTYLDPSLLKKFRESKRLPGLSQLTKREFEVFIQISCGKTDSKIAKDLFVEPAHIKNIKSRVTKKIRQDDVINLLSKLVDNTNPDKKFLSVDKSNLL